MGSTYELSRRLSLSQAYAAAKRLRGSQPIRARQASSPAEEWTRRTGLSFVFAAWYGDPAAAPALEEAYARGRPEIARYAREADLSLPAERLEAYLRDRIRFRIGDRERAGLEQFLRIGRQLGLL